ncbi:MAG: 23S rRNA (uracil(1939)-C(5))-methyltransferase RlmD [Lachnospiraceae bacterium]|nr:23S rRNA (uracil(1939)-C(5))-methyltransferase RlmD [Lachnospiraceae bacterium]
MKKGQIVSGTVKEVRFPNVGIAECEEGEVLVKNVLPGQKVECRIQKKRQGKFQGQLLAITEPSADEAKSPCPHFGQISGCGGCNYQTLPYEKQLQLKQEQLRRIFSGVCPDFDQVFEGILQSPKQYEFRNKMEFSFGDAFKDGPLSLGMHKRGSFYDIVTVDECRIVDADFRMILRAVLDFAQKKELRFYHRMRQEGYLRHLLVRKAAATGEILVGLVTTSRWQEEGKNGSEKEMLQEFSDMLCKLFDNDTNSAGRGRLTGVIHIVNDAIADVVQNDRSEILYGTDHFYEKLCGLTFQISPFSFFQTNSFGAEVLYQKARECCSDYVNQNGQPVIFDLYSGTGTIAQLMAPVAEKVVGVEIVEEAVEAAKENADLNGLHNCEFIAGDVLKVIDTIDEKPDLIILDPPRDGIHPKALPKILAYGVQQIVYISCKPTSLARDLEIMQAAGYVVKRICSVDMFPGTVHVETVVLLGWKDVDEYIYIDYAPDHRNTTRGKATYREIIEYIKKQYGVKVSTLDVAQIKDKCGVEKRENYNKGAEGHFVPQCQPEKEKLIREAFKHFNLI